MTQAPIARERELLGVPVEKIIKNERNPRSAGSFTPEQLTSLRRSRRRSAYCQPLIVSLTDDNDMYLLIEGERRWTSANSKASRSSLSSRRPTASASTTKSWSCSSTRTRSVAVGRWQRSSRPFRSWSRETAISPAMK